ncbi:MAG: hypothetical protein QOF78_782 [Phycisphaerales bacterium]|nr:hypothetical protein [Phycisphaerales bacterium]
MIRSLAGALARWKFIPALPVLIVAMIAAVDARGQAPAPPAPAPPAPAPAAPGGTVSLRPMDDKTKQAASMSATDRSAVDQRVKEVVSILADADPGQQSRARVWLLNETALPGGVAASPAFLDTYAQSISTHLMPLTKHDSPRVRLNAAIVAAEVARAANNTQLAPIALIFLNDKSEAVVLWGMKAARWIIPAQLRMAVGGFNKSLADAIVPTVQRHSQGQVAGAIVVEAYDALTLDVLNQVNFSKVTPAQVGTIAPYVLNLLQARIPLYQKGVPPAPGADATGTRFLTDPKTWPTLGTQQFAAVQAISDLVALAAKQFQAANSLDRIELAGTIRSASLAAATLVASAQAAPIQAAANYNPTQATPSQISGLAGAVQQGLAATPQFGALKPPPPIQGNAPAPAPASAPTTGTVLIPGASTQPVKILENAPHVLPPPTTAPAKAPPAEKAPPAPKTPPGPAAPKAPAAGGAGTDTGAGGPGAPGVTGAGGTTPQKPAR